MNIKDTWPTDAIVYRPTADLVMDMIVRRKHTYLGFSRIEAEKGFLAPTANMSSPKGQEMFRILIFRCIEEMAEASLAEETAHMKEELIDSFNYLLSAIQLDETVLPAHRLLHTLMNQFSSIKEVLKVYRIQDQVLWGLVETLAGSLTDTFRNRAWMENPQDHYFDGARACEEALCSVLTQYLSAFEDFDEFYRFFIAKDEVLKFRLQTAY